LDGGHLRLRGLIDFIFYTPPLNFTHIPEIYPEQKSVLFFIVLFCVVAGYFTVKGSIWALKEHEERHYRTREGPNDPNIYLFIGGGIFVFLYIFYGLLTDFLITGNLLITGICIWIGAKIYRK
jgi:hypothetical protein